MNAYEMKQENRRARLERAADRAEQGAQDAFNRARSAVDGIPFGQPILVGHHSEKRHRAALARQDSAMRRGCELDKLAKELRARAAGVGDAGISSDDPDAVEKLTDKRTDMERLRDDMKRANAHWKKLKTLDGCDIPDDVRKKGLSNLRVWNGVYLVPFPPYALSNLGARIRDAAKRAKRLEARAVVVEFFQATEAGNPTEQVAGATIEQDHADNRVLLRFPARLSKPGYKVVRSYGFLWSPTRNAFVRKFTGDGVTWNARRCAEAVAKLEPWGAAS